MNPDAVQARQSDHPLPGMLSAAVPLWAMRMCNQTLEQIFHQGKLNQLVDALWEAGEAILYRVPGKSAAGFNALAEIIATLAFCPGGVRCFGMHFEYTPGNWHGGKHGVPVDRPTNVPNADPAAELRQVAVLIKNVPRTVTVKRAAR